MILFRIEIHAKKMNSFHFKSDIHDKSISNIIITVTDEFIKKL